MSVRVADWYYENPESSVAMNETEEVPDIVEFRELKNRVESLEKNLDTAARSILVISETVARLRREVEGAS